MKSSDFGFIMEKFGETIEMILDKVFIKDAKVIRCGKKSRMEVVFHINTKLTLEGINYLKENNLLDKTYR
ncbi:YjcQ family protein [Clostridium sporogenes]|nr:YjcQ family protein [Clostridium sporogenes]